MLFKRLHFRITLHLLVITLSFCVLNSYAQDDTIDINTDLVPVPVTVYDRQGKYLTDLKKENFQILENDIVQEIIFFESVNQPITVFLLFDVSGSMGKFALQMADASKVFFNQLHPHDQIIAASFADETKTYIKRTKVSELKNGIKIAPHYRIKGTNLLDAVDYTLEKMRKVEGRKAIIVFSDGFGSGKYSTYDDNFKEAEEGESIIYTIQFDNAPKTPSPYTSKKRFDQIMRNRDIYMRTLAEITGGSRYKLDYISGLEETFKKIADELSQQYILGYYPKNLGEKGERREIKVKVNIPDVAVRARKSYIVREN